MYVFWKLNLFSLDIDECGDGTANCHSDATCTNTLGGFNCTCDDGFQGDGVDCIGKGTIEVFHCKILQTSFVQI